MKEKTILERGTYILKGLFCSGGYGALFVLIEAITGTAAVMYKLMTDEAYYYALADSLNEGNQIEYLRLIGQVIPMTMYATFFVMFLIIYGKSRRRREVVYRTVDFWFIPMLVGAGIALNLIVECFISLVPEDVIYAYNQNFNYLEGMSVRAMFLSVGLIGPVVEEYFFRHLMMNKLKEEKWVAILAPAIMFGIAHGNLVQSTYATLLGILFGYIYYQTENLTYTTILHVTINSSSLVLELLPRNGQLAMCITLLALGCLGFVKVSNRGYLQFES